jgi:hypothetical protein
LYSLLGKDMRTYDNFDLQIILAALSATLIFVLLYLIGTYLISRSASLFITFIAVMGSSLASTLGSALWTLNFSTLFIVLILLLLVRDTAGKPLNPYILGLLLFLCYFSRASTVVFILPVLAYLFWQRRFLFWPAALTAMALLLLYLGWSRLEYGQWLPDYYSLTRLQVERAPLLVGILGNLLSPSRGIFVFSPFFLLILAGIPILWNNLARQPLFWLCVVWFVLQLVIVSRAASWWGGNSFGPRLLTDALPGLVLLLFLLWQEVLQQFSTAQQNVTFALFLFLGLVAIAIHINGLYRPAILRWDLNIIPTPTHISNPMGDYFDWRYTQFLTTNEMVCQIAAEKAQAYLDYDETLASYKIGQVITAHADRAVPIFILDTLKRMAKATPISKLASGTEAAANQAAHHAYLPAIAYSANGALFIGWEELVDGTARRQSICPQTEIVFRLADEPINEDTYWLTISADSFGDQPVVIYLNDALIDQITWPGKPNMISLKFPARLLQPGALNRISFHFPSAQTTLPRLNDFRLHFDDRQFALGFQDLAINSSAGLQPTRTATPLPYP